MVLYKFIYLQEGRARDLKIFPRTQLTQASFFALKNGNHVQIRSKLDFYDFSEYNKTKLFVCLSVFVVFKTPF